MATPCASSHTTRSMNVQTASACARNAPSDSNSRIRRDHGLTQRQPRVTRGHTLMYGNLNAARPHSPDDSFAESDVEKAATRQHHAMGATLLRSLCRG